MARPEKESIRPRRGIDEVAQFWRWYGSNHGDIVQSGYGWGCTDDRVVEAYPPITSLIPIPEGGGGVGGGGGGLGQCSDKFCRLGNNGYGGGRGRG